MKHKATFCIATIYVDKVFIAKACVLFNMVILAYVYKFTEQQDLSTQGNSSFMIVNKLKITFFFITNKKLKISPKIKLKKLKKLIQFKKN